MGEQGQVAPLDAERHHRHARLRGRPGRCARGVPKVLADLEILGLRILRWSREYGKAAPVRGPHSFPRASYPRLSVRTPSVHDTSTLRGWWEEDQEEREAYYRFLGEPVSVRLK